MARIDHHNKCEITWLSYTEGVVLHSVFSLWIYSPCLGWSPKALAGQLFWVCLSSRHCELSSLGLLHAAARRFLPSFLLGWARQDQGQDLAFPLSLILALSITAATHQLPGTWGFGWHRSAHQPCVRVPGVNLCLLSCFLPGLFGSSSRSTSFELFIEGYPSPLEQLCCFLLSCAVPMSLTGLGKLWVAPADGQRWWSMPPSCHGRGERSRPDQYNYLGAEQMKKHSYSQSCCPQSVARVLFPGGEMWRSHIVPALHRVISAAQVGAVAGELGVCGCCRHEVFRPFPSCPHLSAPRFARPRFHASFQPLSSTFRLSLWWWL